MAAMAITALTHERSHTMLWNFVVRLPPAIEEHLLNQSATAVLWILWLLRGFLKDLVGFSDEILVISWNKEVCRVLDWIVLERHFLFACSLQLTGYWAVKENWVVDMHWMSLDEDPSSVWSVQAWTHIHACTYVYALYIQRWFKQQKESILLQLWHWLNATLWLF